MKEIVAKQLEDWEIATVIAGKATLDEEWQGENVRSPFSRFYVIRQGSATVLCEGQTVTLKAGYGYLIPAGTSFSYYGHPEGLQKLFYHLFIRGAEPLDFLSRLHGVFTVLVNGERQERLWELYEREDVLSVPETKRILYEIVTEILNKHRTVWQEKQPRSPCVRAAVDYLGVHVRLGITAETLAEQSCVSVSVLRKKFREEMGVSVGAYLDELVIEKAGHLLIHTHLSVRDVGATVGFEDPFYFSRRFKQKTGRTPLQYRKENALFML